MRMIEATVKEYLIVQTEVNRKISRNIEHYNLDMIISLRYWVHRKWRLISVRERLTPACYEYFRYKS